MVGAGGQGSALCTMVHEHNSALAAQDLAVVVLLMLIPLLAPSESGAPAGFSTIARALGIAAVKVRSPLPRTAHGVWPPASCCLL